MIPNFQQDQSKNHMFVSQLHQDISHDSNFQLPISGSSFKPVIPTPQRHQYQEVKLFSSLQDILQIKKRRAKNPKNTQPKIKRVKDVIEENPNLKKGHWSTIESKRYHWFLEIYNQHFIDKQRRRMDKIFKTMAQFIGTREAQQCRSHHQKMQKKYHTFYKIIGALRKGFYSTIDPHQIIQEIKQNGYQITNKMIQATQIQNQRSQPNDQECGDQGYDNQNNAKEQECEDFRKQNLLEQDDENQLNLQLPWKP